MTSTETAKAARKIRAGADPTPYLVDGVLPDSLLDAICDLANQGVPQANEPAGWRA